MFGKKIFFENFTPGHFLIFKSEFSKELMQSIQAFWTENKWYNMNISVLNMGKREMLIKLEREYLFQNIGSSLRTSFMMEKIEK